MQIYRVITSSLILLSALTATRSHAEAEPVTQLYNRLCASCHVAQGPPTLAPPIFAVKAHVIQVYPERSAFVDYLVQWVAAPDASKTLMPGATRRFGVMPKLGYDPAEVRRIAEYLYDTRLNEPDWFREHYKAEHGRAPQR